MRGKVTSVFEGRLILTPDGSKGCNVFCEESDLPGSFDNAYTFDVEPTEIGIWKATNLKVDTE